RLNLMQEPRDLPDLLPNNEITLLVGICRPVDRVKLLAAGGARKVTNLGPADSCVPATNEVLGVAPALRTNTPNIAHAIALCFNGRISSSKWIGSNLGPIDEIVLNSFFVCH